MHVLIPLWSLLLEVVYSYWELSILVIEFHYKNLRFLVIEDTELPPVELPENVDGIKKENILVNIHIDDSVSL